MEEAKLARGFQFLRNEVLRNGEFAQTLVLSENEKALDLLTSRRCGLPGYFPCGEYDYFLIGLRHSPSPSPRLQVRRATPRDVPLMQEFFDREAPRKQFFPAYRFDELDRSAYYRDMRNWKIFSWPGLGMNWSGYWVPGIKATTRKFSSGATGAG